MLLKILELNKIKSVVMGTINDEEELQRSLEEGQKETQLLIHEEACNGQTKQHHVVLSNSAADDPNSL